MVIGVLSLVDREEGGRERIEAAGYHVRSLAKAAEIVTRMRS
jgi:orotate phosphoribosyltransferase